MGNDRTVTVAFADLQMVFDTATNSMDFGSGFLDDEEIEALRRIAIVLGVDPIVAEPESYQAKRPHRFSPWTRSDSSPTAHLRCRLCEKREDDPLHAPGP